MFATRTITHENNWILRFAAAALAASILGCGDPPPPRAPASVPQWQPPPGYGPVVSPPAWGAQPQSPFGAQPPGPFGMQPPVAPIAPVASSPLPPPLVPPVPANSGVARDPSRPANGTVANAGSVIGAMSGDFRRCYDAGLRQDPDMAGSVRLDTRIDAKGEVSGVTTADVKGLSKEVVACLVERVKKASFAPPEGGSATIAIPVTFKIKQ